MNTACVQCGAGDGIEYVCGIGWCSICLTAFKDELEKRGWNTRTPHKRERCVDLIDLADLTAENIDKSERIAELEAEVKELETDLAGDIRTRKLPDVWFPADVPPDTDRQVLTYHVRIDYFGISTYDVGDNFWPLTVPDFWRELVAPSAPDSGEGG